MGGGDSLYDKIDKGLRSCKLVVSCVTEKYSLSQNCRREIALADGIKKPIIPLLADANLSWPPAGPMSMPLSQLSYIDCTKTHDLADGPEFDVLLARLKQEGMASQLAGAKIEEAFVKRKDDTSSDKNYSGDQYKQRNIGGVSTKPEVQGSNISDTKTSKSCQIL